MMDQMTTPTVCFGLLSALLSALFLDAADSFITAKRSKNMPPIQHQTVDSK